MSIRLSREVDEATAYLQVRVRELVVRILKVVDGLLIVHLSQCKKARNHLMNRPITMSDTAGKSSRVVIISFTSDGIIAIVIDV